MNIHEQSLKDINVNINACFLTIEYKKLMSSADGDIDFKKEQKNIKKILGDEYPKINFFVFVGPISSIRFKNIPSSARMIIKQKVESLITKYLLERL